MCFPAIQVFYSSALHTLAHVGDSGKPPHPAVLLQDVYIRNPAFPAHASYCRPPPPRMHAWLSPHAWHLLVRTAAARKACLCHTGSAPCGEMMLAVCHRHTACRQGRAAPAGTDPIPARRAAPPVPGRNPAGRARRSPAAVSRRRAPPRSGVPACSPHARAAGAAPARAAGAAPARAAPALRAFSGGKRAAAMNSPMLDAPGRLLAAMGDAPRSPLM